MLIGEGVSSYVFKKKHKVYKIFKEYGSIAKEIAIMRLLKFPINYGFKNDMYYISMPYYGNNLHNVINLNQLYNKKSICEQILEGINYLHSHNIIHRDLKPYNIMILDTHVESPMEHSIECQSIKIIDFGMSIFVNTAVIVSNDNDNIFLAYEENLTTICYRAPELLLKCNYNKEIDIWAFGCIIYHIYTGKLLFKDKTEKELYKSINNFVSNIDDLTEFIDVTNDIIKGYTISDLLKECLKLNPYNRYQSAKHNITFTSKEINLTISNNHLKTIYNKIIECDINIEVYYLAIYIWHLYTSILKLENDTNLEYLYKIMYNCISIAENFIFNIQYENIYPEIYTDIILKTKCDFLIQLQYIPLSDTFLEIDKIIYLKTLTF